MAIDSEIKRKSIAAIAAPYIGAVIVPDSTIDNPDRQAIAYSYSGITADNPISITVPIMYRHLTQLLD